MAEDKENSSSRSQESRTPGSAHCVRNCLQRFEVCKTKSKNILNNSQVEEIREREKKVKLSTGNCSLNLKVFPSKVFLLVILPNGSRQHAENH